MFPYLCLACYLKTGPRLISLVGGITKLNAKSLAYVLLCHFFCATSNITWIENNLHIYTHSLLFIQQTGIHLIMMIHLILYTDISWIITYISIPRDPTYKTILNVYTNRNTHQTETIREWLMSYWGILMNKYIQNTIKNGWCHSEVNWCTNTYSLYTLSTVHSKHKIITY